MSDDTTERPFLSSGTPPHDTDEQDVEHSEHDESLTDGRCVKIETPHYSVQTWGDPGDSFDEVLDKAEAAAERAKADVKEINDEDDKGGFR
mgnify:CR=1 FL=1